MEQLMVSSKKSKDLLNIFKPELDELNSENNDYINIYQYTYMFWLKYSNTNVEKVV